MSECILLIVSVLLKFFFEQILSRDGVLAEEHTSNVAFSVDHMWHVMMQANEIVKRASAWQCASFPRGACWGW